MNDDKDKDKDKDTGSGKGEGRSEDEVEVLPDLPDLRTPSRASPVRPVGQVYSEADLELLRAFNKQEEEEEDLVRASSGSPVKRLEHRVQIWTTILEKLPVNDRPCPGPDDLALRMALDRLDAKERTEHAEHAKKTALIARRLNVIHGLPPFELRIDTGTDRSSSEAAAAAAATSSSSPPDTLQAQQPADTRKPATLLSLDSFRTAPTQQPEQRNNLSYTYYPGTNRQYRTLYTPTAYSATVSPITLNKYSSRSDFSHLWNPLFTLILLSNAGLLGGSIFALIVSARCDQVVFSMLVALAGICGLEMGLAVFRLFARSRFALRFAPFPISQKFSHKNFFPSHINTFLTLTCTLLFIQLSLALAALSLLFTPPNSECKSNSPVFPVTCAVFATSCVLLCAVVGVWIYGEF